MNGIKHLPTKSQRKLAFCMGVAVCALALPPAARAGSASPEPGFLLPEQAFALSVDASGPASIGAVFDVAAGYYLYRARLQFTATPESLGPPGLPAPQKQFDETFQKEVDVDRGRVRVELPIQPTAGSFALAIDYQGCADRGLCYAPQQWQGDVVRTGGAWRVVARSPGQVAGATQTLGDGPPTVKSTAGAAMPSDEPAHLPSSGWLAVSVSVAALLAVLAARWFRRKKSMR